MSSWQYSSFQNTIIEITSSNPPCNQDEIESVLHSNVAAVDFLIIGQITVLWDSPLKLFSYIFIQAS